MAKSLKILILEDIQDDVGLIEHMLRKEGLTFSARRVVESVDRTLNDRLWKDAGTNDWLAERIPALETGATNPFAVALDLIARSGDLMTGRKS